MKTAENLQVETIATVGKAPKREFEGWLHQLSLAAALLFSGSPAFLQLESSAYTQRGTVAVSPDNPSTKLNPPEGN